MFVDMETVVVVEREDSVSKGRLHVMCVWGHVVGAFISVNIFSFSCWIGMGTVSYGRQL